jgi:hypothetical protein
MLFYNSIKLFQIIRKLNIDLITVNDFYNLLPAVYKIARGKVPYVCYVRFLPSKFPNALSICGAPRIVDMLTKLLLYRSRKKRVTLSGPGNRHKQ